MAESYIFFRQSLEKLLNGELIVIREGKVVRKLCDYYAVPELNENIGKLDYEVTDKMTGWVDIAAFSDYLFEFL